MFALVAASPEKAVATSAAADTQRFLPLTSAFFCRFTTMLPMVAGAAPPLAMVIVPSAQICALGCATGVLEPFLVAVTVHVMSPGDWIVETFAVFAIVQVFSDVLQYESVAPDRLILAWWAN